jgi:hypothetical protein
VTDRVIEVSDEGTLHLAPDVLGNAPPRTRYVVNVRGDTIVLRQVTGRTPFWATASSQERADDLVEWASRHEDGPGLPDEALRREYLYD